MLLDGTLTFAASHDYRRAGDPKVRRMRERIEAIPDPAIYNQVRGWRCVMEITLRDGRRVTAQTMAAKGSPDNPLNHNDVTEKALDLMAPVLGKARSRTLIAALFDIQKLENVGVLRKLYSA